MLPLESSWAVSAAGGVGGATGAVGTSSGPQGSRSGQPRGAGEEQQEEDGTRSLLFLSLNCQSNTSITADIHV